MPNMSVVSIKPEQRAKNMTNVNAPMWGIHAGATGDADNLFLQENRIGIGWTLMGDLSLIPNDIYAFRHRLSSVYPHYKPGAIPINAGQLHRFIHIMQVGDIIAYPSKKDKQIHIGEVSGDYSFDPSDPGYPNQRSVTWLKHSPRTSFPPAALFEAGSAMSLFRIQNYDSSFRSVLDSQQALNVTNPNTTTVNSDPVPPLIADNIEDITRDFILSQLSLHLRGHPLAAFVAHLFETMGYRTQISPPGADGGVDIVAHKDEFALLPPIIKVQVKSSSSSVGGPEVAYLNGVLGQSEYGILVTIGTFTNAAKSNASGMSRVRLIDGSALTDLVLQHYDALDPKYKSIVPLKKVYAPDETDYQSN